MTSSNEQFPEENLPDLEEETPHTYTEVKTPFSNQTYDQIKFLAVVVLPAIGALYFGLSQIWGFPKGEEVVGTIALVDTFLGVVINRLSSSYQEQTEGRLAGVLTVDDSGDKMVVGMNFPGSKEDLLRTQDKVTFKIDRQG